MVHTLTVFSLRSRPIRQRNSFTDSVHCRSGRYPPEPWTTVFHRDGNADRVGERISQSSWAEICALRR
jgi:hypothetical protein